MAAKGHEKLIDDIAGLSVLELSELVKALEDKFGVSAAMPAAVAAAPAAGAQVEAAEEKSEFKVTLKEIGSEKIKVIKAVKSLTGLGLADAKKAVEGAPTVLGDAVKKEDAQKMKTELEAVGAKVELA